MSPFKMVLEPKCQKCSYETEPKKFLWSQTVHKCLVKLNRIVLWCCYVVVVTGGGDFAKVVGVSADGLTRSCTSGIAEALSSSDR